jgi:hypothetical protein
MNEKIKTIYILLAFMSKKNSQNIFFAQIGQKKLIEKNILCIQSNK